MIETNRDLENVRRKMIDKADVYIAELEAIIAIQRVFSILEMEGEIPPNQDEINFIIIPYLMEDLKLHLKHKYSEEIERLEKEEISLKTGGNE